MAAQRVDARIERRVGALGGVGRERAGDQRRLEHALDREQAGERLRGRELRAVEQREPFLRAEHDRREPGARERGGGRHALAGELALRRRRAWPPPCARAARDRRRRRPSPGAGPPGSGRAPAWLRAGRRCRGRTPEAPRPRLASFSAIIRRTIAGRHRLADAGRMREHDVALQRREIVGRDAHAGELAEAGIDAVDRLAAGDDGVDRPRARLDRRPGGGVEAARRRRARSRASRRASRGPASA